MMMDLDHDEYEVITKKPLKLSSSDDKSSSVSKSRTKKKKSKSSSQSSSKGDPLAGVSDVSKVIVPTTTEAERAFKAKQDKIAHKRILQKASKTHKQRVEEFNKHLDSLSEHYDIPKVSWTK